MALFPGLPRWAGTRNVKPMWILLKQETVSGSGISWAICKSARRFRQITTRATHHSVFLQAGALPAARPTASKHWRHAGCPGKGVVKRVSCSYCNPCCSCRTWMTTLVLLWRRWCTTSDSVKWDFPHPTTNARMKCSKSTRSTVSSL